MTPPAPLMTSSPGSTGGSRSTGRAAAAAPHARRDAAVEPRHDALEAVVSSARPRAPA
jgi:hypothetical protein